MVAPAAGDAAPRPVAGFWLAARSRDGRVKVPLGNAKTCAFPRASPGPAGRGAEMATLGAEAEASAAEIVAEELRPSPVMVSGCCSGEMVSM